MADVTVKDINVQAVETPTYLWGINAVGRACRAVPVISVVGLTEVITQAQLRTALGLGGAAYLSVGTTTGTVAAGDHTHTAGSLGAEPSITAGTTAQYWRGDKTWTTLDKASVGLGNVDNTTDANKPISSATQTALNGKEATVASGTSAQYWRGDKVWTTLDKAAVGLNNVDNTSDADKPVSSATQTALNGKEATISSGTTAQYWRGDKTWTPFPSIQAPIQVNEEGTQVAAAGAATILNFTGAGVTASFAGNTVTVDVPNSGGGGWTAVDASSTVKGILKLTNDLGGTADLPVVAKINGIAISGTCASGYAITGDSASTASWKVLNKSSVGLSNVDNTSDADKPVSTAQQTALDAKAPLANPTFTGNVSVPNINGAALGPKNKLFNGCMRIPSPYGASGGAALGGSLIGAAGVVIWIGGFTTFTGAIFHETGVQDIRTSSGGLVRVAFTSTTGGSGSVVFSMRISAEDALTMAGKPITASCRLYGATTSPATSWLRRYKANGYNDFSAPVFIGDGSKLNTSAMAGSPIDLEYTFTPTYADCINGMQIDVVGEYTGANGNPQSPAYLSVANFQVIEGSKRLPFEARPLELEKALVNRFKSTAPINLTANTTLASDSKYSYSANLVLTLPPNPENGDVIPIYNTGTVLTTIVGRNGKTIMGLAQDMTLDIANKKYVFEYLSASSDWRLS